ncbi:hypothetical protein GCM10010286_43050 [Streptomyces toxytricini]|nr:hypothetical protein GCM10010286_43050 [Streptomyces toxytricini]
MPFARDTYHPESGTTQHGPRGERFWIAMPADVNTSSPGDFPGADRDGLNRAGVPTRRLRQVWSVAGH